MNGHKDLAFFAPLLTTHPSMFGCLLYHIASWGICLPLFVWRWFYTFFLFVCLVAVTWRLVIFWCVPGNNFREHYHNTYFNHYTAVKKKPLLNCCWDVASLASWWLLHIKMMKNGHVFSLIHGMSKDSTGTNTKCEH